MQLSMSEENYLKAIYKISERVQEAVSTNSLADGLGIRPATATDMLKKLSDKGLINYVKYQGVTLTTSGHYIAINIIRKHRLWELFLVEKLEFNWDEVHDIAEQLEHIQSDKLIHQLDKYLDFPKVDPHGDPIPDAAGVIDHDERRPLSTFHVGQTLSITGVVDHATAFFNHLNKLGIELGSVVTILEIDPYDGSCSIALEDKANLFISAQTANNLLAH